MPEAGESGPAARRDAWRAGLLLACCLVVSHYDVVFLGRSLLPTNYRNPVDFRLTDDNYGPHRVSHDEWTRHNLLPWGNIRDPGATWWQWEPSIHFWKQAIQRREWPFWDPYIAGGTPAMANLVPAFFFPPSLVIVLLGASAGLLNAYFLFLLWAGGFFTFLFLRRHDVTFAGAMTGAIAVLFSGTMQQHAGTFIGQTAAGLPLVLYVSRVLLDRPDARGAALLAGIYAMVALASFPPVLLCIFIVATLYVVIAVISEAGLSRRHVILWWSAGTILSLGLVSFYYLPALLLRAASPQMAEAYRHAGMEYLPAVLVYQLLSPTLMGGVPRYLNGPAPATGAGYLPYIGIVAIALCGLARTSSSPRSRTLLWTCTLGSFGILLKVFGAAVVHWTGSLPLLREIHIAAYFGIAVPVLIGCLSALGLDSLRHDSFRRWRALLAAAIALVLTGSLWQVGVRKLQVFGTPFEPYWKHDWQALALFTVLTATVLALAALGRHRRGLRLGSVAALIGLCLTEGLYNGRSPRPAAWNLFDHPPEHVRIVQQASPPSRILPAGGLGPNTNSVFEVASLGSLMAFNPVRTYRLFARYCAPNPEVFIRDPKQLPPEAVLDRANVGLIPTSSYVPDIVAQARSRGYESLYDDGTFQVFARRTAPRYLFSSEYKVVPAEAALDAIAEPDADEIILESDPGFTRQKNTPADPEVKLISFGLNSVVLSVNAPRPGLVYASESYLDGWTATVNGRATAILPANYAFRAVTVPAGPSTVAFSYWPPGLTVGLLVSCAALAIACTLLAAARRERRRSITAPVSVQQTTSAGP